MTNSIRRIAAAGSVTLLVAALLTGFGAPASAAPVRIRGRARHDHQRCVESNHAGFTGTGFVNSANAVGAGVEFTVTPATAGARQLVVPLRQRHHRQPARTGHAQRQLGDHRAVPGDRRLDDLAARRP